MNSQNLYGNNLLHRSAWGGHFDIVEYLVKEEKFSVNATNNDGNTPLHFAAREGHFEIALYLIQNSADLAAENSKGERPDVIAKSPHIQELLIDSAKKAKIGGGYIVHP